MSRDDNQRSEPAVGRYLVLGVIAQGDMGVVYRAMDSILGCEVAVKAVDARFGPGSAVAHQFVDANRIMVRLQHPGSRRSTTSARSRTAGRSSPCG